MCCFFFLFYLVLFRGIYVSHSIDHDPKQSELNAFVSIFSLELSMHTTLFGLCRLWLCQSIWHISFETILSTSDENRFCRLVNKLSAASVLNLSPLYPIDATRVEHFKHTLFAVYTQRMIYESRRSHTAHQFNAISSATTIVTMWRKKCKWIEILFN